MNAPGKKICTPTELSAKIPRGYWMRLATMPSDVSDRGCGGDTPALTPTTQYSNVSQPVFGSRTILGGQS